MFDRFSHFFCKELGLSNGEEGELSFDYSSHRATVQARDKKDRKGTEEIDEGMESLRAKDLLDFSERSVTGILVVCTAKTRT